MTRKQDHQQRTYAQNKHEGCSTSSACRECVLVHTERGRIGNAGVEARQKSGAFDWKNSLCYHQNESILSNNKRDSLEKRGKKKGNVKDTPLIEGLEFDSQGCKSLGSCPLTQHPRASITSVLYKFLPQEAGT